MPATKRSEKGLLTPDNCVVALIVNNRAEIRQAIDDAAAGRLGAIPACNLAAKEKIE